MLKKIDGDDHQLNGLFIVFTTAEAVDRQASRAGPFRPQPLRPSPAIYLCDESQLQEATELATDDDGEPHPAMIIPLTDMQQLAGLLQHGWTTWIRALPSAVEKAA